MSVLFYKYDIPVGRNLPHRDVIFILLYQQNTRHKRGKNRAALTTHKLKWLEPWGKLAELELKSSNRELVYVGNTNVTQST